MSKIKEILKLIEQYKNGRNLSADVVSYLKKKLALMITKEVLKKVLIWSLPFLLPALLIAMGIIGFMSMFFPSSAKASDNKLSDTVTTEAHADYVNFESITRQEANKYEDGDEFKLPWAVLESTDTGFLGGTDEFYRDKEGYYYYKNEDGNFYYLDEKGNIVQYKKIQGSLTKVSRAEFIQNAKDQLRTDYVETKEVEDIYVTYSWVEGSTDSVTGVSTPGYWNRNETREKKSIVLKAITWEGTVTRDYKPVEYGSDSPPGPYSKIWEYTESNTYDYVKFDTFAKEQAPKIYEAQLELMKYSIYSLLGQGPSNGKYYLEGMRREGLTTSLTPEQIAEIKKLLPADLDENRYYIVLKAYELLGKVDYFWGGHSLEIGWDSAWGTPRVVTAGGSRTSGTSRPYGLDCSGFVYWVYNNVFTDGGSIGYPSGAQASNCVKIKKEELLPGDLVFIVNSAGANVHVGIVAGRDADNKIYVIHENGGAQNISVDELDSQGFNVFGRPNIRNMGAMNGLYTGSADVEEYISNIVENESEMDLFIRLVNAEGGGTGDEGIMAVTEVVLNRLRRPEWNYSPKTLYTVIHAPLQFEVVSRGTINNKPDSAQYNRIRNLITKTITERTNYSYGATFFCSYPAGSASEQSYMSANRLQFTGADYGNRFYRPINR